VLRALYWARVVSYRGKENAMKHGATFVLSAMLCLPAAAFADPPGFAGARGAQAQEVLSGVQGRVPDKAQPGIQRAREAVGVRGGAHPGVGGGRHGREREYGLDEARRNVERGTSVSGEVLGEVEDRVPEQAKPAIGVSREAGRTGPRAADEALERARGAPGGPPYGAGDFGRPPFGGPGGIGHPPFGVGPGAGGPPMGIPGGRR
jgi:hypothetical protein